MKIILILILLAFTFYGCSQSVVLSQKKNYNTDAYNILYPESWKPDTSKMMGTDLVIFSPLENEEDKFSENINIMIQDLDNQNIDLERYKEISDNQIRELFADSEVFESAVIKSNGADYYKMIYTMMQGDFRLKITSICFIKNDKAYLATFTVELDKYDNYKKVGNEILSSFKLR